MSIKFAIRNTADKAAKEGDIFVRFSGTGEPFNRHCERASRTLEVDGKGYATKWRFATGLDPNLVEYYDWLTDEEKPVVADAIKELLPKIEKFYGGSSILHPENATFWKRRKDVSEITVTHENIEAFYDTEKPAHALLYLSVIGGAFSDVIAPNKDWAERYQIPHYLALEIETTDYSDEDDITRSDAHGELALIRKEFGKDALFILAWCLQYETTAFGAYNQSVTEKDLIQYHIKYIDGKLSLKNKRKRNFPKMFMEYAEKWRGPQSRQLLMIEAYVKSGEYFSFITQREKKYVTDAGTILGNTIDEAVKNLMKTKFNVDMERLRDQVEAKWKE